MKYVIIGGSAAGVNAAEVLRKNDKKCDITLISEEESLLYSRCLLTYLIAGSIGEEKLYFKDRDFYKANKIKTYLGKKAISIDRKKKEMLLDDETKVLYDKLLIATGASAKTVDIKGADKRGVFTVRNIEDARRIIKMLDKVKHVVVLGGGLIGLKDAYALRVKGKEVTVVVRSQHVLSQMVDPEAATIIAGKLAASGIKIETCVAAKEIKGKGAIEEVVLDNGKTIKCELVIIGKGVEPNVEIAKKSGLKVDQGITVNQYLETSDENIFAAGDVAETRDIARGTPRVNALWPCAVAQGRVAAFNMLGKKQIYEGSLSMNSVDFFGLASISMGITKPKEGGSEIINATRGENYKKFILKNNIIVGMVLVGDISAAGVISVLIKRKIDVSSIKDMLYEDSFNYAKMLPLVRKFKDKFSEEEFRDTVISYKL